MNLTAPLTRNRFKVATSRAHETTPTVSWCLRTRKAQENLEQSIKKHRCICSEFHVVGSVHTVRTARTGSWSTTKAGLVRSDQIVRGDRDLSS